MSAPPSNCPEKRRLLDEFFRAVSEYQRLQSAQVAALLKDENFRFEKEIGEAGLHRSNAKEAVLAHEKEHGC